MVSTSIFISNVLSGSRKIPPWKIPTQKIPTQQIPPWKVPTQKILTQKIPTWNIPTYFIICLSSLNTASIIGGRVYMYILLIFPGWLRVFSWNFGNINKIFIRNIFSALSLKYKVSAHD